MLRWGGLPLHSPPMIRPRCYRLFFSAAALTAASFLFAVSPTSAEEENGATKLQKAPVQGWLTWRGPQMNGSTEETGLPDKLEEPLWTYDLSGGGTPVLAGDRLYVFGYTGAGKEVVEVLACLDAATGEEIWKKVFPDFMSDHIYNRYGIGAPEIDPETGNIYLLTSPGLALAFAPDGKELWRRSMLEEFGRLTFPNGRVGNPAITEDLVIFRGITANWGGGGPARDRFYGFDKITGQLVYASEPGIEPIDSSYSALVFDDLGQRRVFYSGTGCGNVICADARTGQPVWRVLVSKGGVNASPLLLKDDVLIITTGKENIDDSSSGRMYALRIPTEVPEGIAEGPKVFDVSEIEIWRNDAGDSFTSSPVTDGEFIYQITVRGELLVINAESGETVKEIKLSPDNLHSSPLLAGDRLYVPVFDGKFYIISTGKDAEILSEIELAGNATGAPAVWNGRVYVITKEKLYCFGSADGGNPPETMMAVPAGSPDEAAQLQVVPSEFVMRPGDRKVFDVVSIDATGRHVEAIDNATWEKWIPPTAKVQAEIDAEFNDEGTFISNADAELSAGAVKATANGLTGTARGRMLPDLPYAEDFEGFELNTELADGTKFSFPPLPWIGARLRWQVIEGEDGNKYIGNTLDRVLFQRSKNFIGDHALANYTLEADVMTDGNRRVMSSVGLINQRYIIALVGNGQKLEVSSNYERLAESVPFTIKPQTWYTLKTRVDVADDRTGVVRAKAWEKGSDEPEEWTIEVSVPVAHENGSPGIYAFSPQSLKRVFIDNISINYSNPL